MNRPPSTRRPTATPNRNPAPVGQRVPVDPRIRRRRIEIRRDEGRRRLRLILTTVGLVAVVAIAWAITRSPLLSISHIDVAGAQHTSASQIIEASGLRRGGAMTDISEDTVRSRIERLPWAASAKVVRRWPRDVRLIITERVPVVSVRGQSAGWMLVDSDGRYLAVVPNPVDDLPAIEGAQAKAGPGGQMPDSAIGALKVALGIPHARVPVVRVVALGGDGTIQLHLAPPPTGPGGIVEFGPPDQIAEKLTAVFTVLDRVDSRCLSRLDVRVPGAPVIVRNP